MASEALAQERLFALRETITRMEGKSTSRFAAASLGEGFGKDVQAAQETEEPALAFGIPPLDAVLDGGLPEAGLAEIRSDALRNAGAATGFVLSLCAFLQERGKPRACPRKAILWVGERNVSREAGEPYAPGLENLGLDPASLVYALPRKLEEALWIAEAGLTSRAFRAVILEIHGNPRHFGLSESRRLSLRARHAGCLILLLRQGGGEEAGSTLFRIGARPAPSGFYRLPEGAVLSGTIGNPGFSLSIEKSPKPASLPSSQAMIIEWNAHERLFLEPEPKLPAFRRPAATAHPGAHLPEPSDRPDRAAAVGSVLAFSRAS